MGVFGRVSAPRLACDTRNSVHLGKVLEAADFEVKGPDNAEEVTVRVIGVVENQAPTEALTATLPVVDGVIEGQSAVLPDALVKRTGNGCGW